MMPSNHACSGKNFPFRKSVSDLDVDLAPGTGDLEYMAALRTALRRVLDFRPDLVIYDAGVDVWEGDELGHLSITHAGIWQRDAHVITSCVRAGVPIACVIGGGYDRDANALARRHALLHRVVAQAWLHNGLGCRDSEK